jgi:hypothetical protein
VILFWRTNEIICCGESQVPIARREVRPHVDDASSTASVFSSFFLFAHQQFRMQEQGKQHLIAHHPSRSFLASFATLVCSPALRHRRRPAAAHNFLVKTLYTPFHNICTNLRQDECFCPQLQYHSTVSHYWKDSAMERSILWWRSLDRWKYNLSHDYMTTWS